MKGEDPATPGYYLGSVETRKPRDCNDSPPGMDLSGGYGDLVYVTVMLLIRCCCGGGVSLILAFSWEALPTLSSDTSPRIPNWPWAWPYWNCTGSYRFSVSVKKMGEVWTRGASNIVKAECSREDPRASGGLIFNLPHPGFIKTKHHRRNCCWNRRASCVATKQAKNQKKMGRVHLSLQGHKKPWDRNDSPISV